MLAMLGLAHLSRADIWLLATILMAVAFLVGWVLDMIMDRQGFGLIGNGLLVTFAAVVGAYVYNRYFGNFRSPDMKVVIAVMLGSVVVHVFAMVVVRRVLRLN